MKANANQLARFGFEAESDGPLVDFRLIADSDRSRFWPNGYRSLSLRFHANSIHERKDGTLFYVPATRTSTVMIVSIKATGKWRSAKLKCEPQACRIRVKFHEETDYEWSRDSIGWLYATRTGSTS